MVYAQEHLAEFVDWAGVGFFAQENLLVNNKPVPFPVRCRVRVCGYRHRLKDRDRTRCDCRNLFRRSTAHGSELPTMILDWDIIQIEGALLETWLPTVFRRLDELAQQCGST